MSTCCAMGCLTRCEMRARHGTPEQFEKSVMLALDMVTPEEALIAVRSYKKLYEAAPEGFESS